MTFCEAACIDLRIRFADNAALCADPVIGFSTA
jgi:hypothetical protein